MRKNLRKRILLAVLLLFTAANILLLYFDSGEKVERKAYINSWSGTFTDDLQETLHMRGVFAAAENSPVYFEDENGSFDDFLVNEGDEIAEGDDLYTYQVTDYEQQTEALQLEAGKLQEEIAAIDTYVQEMEAASLEEQESESFGIPSSGEDEDKEQDQASSAAAQIIKDEAIAEKIKERSQMEAQLTMVEEELEQLTSTGQTITVQSPVAGVVTGLSETLEDPLLTISSTDLLVKGQLREKYRKLVEEQMAAAITLADDGKSTEMEGTVTKIHTFSDNTNANKVSKYPVEITIPEVSEEILPGYHADVDIITSESTDALAVLEPALKTEEQPYVWQMNKDGRVYYKQVETGLRDDGRIEIVNGIEENTKLAVSEKNHYRNGIPFITRMDLDQLHVKKVGKQSASVIKENLFLGLFNR
ncbi:efflux RND transporter periplasmic adaptor subunit [Halobacillus massiliensis]|uniref:efflux RND transporter periplasmic adaptor subunit n=1 Tax=Halobacillus massiliensis TaxID=1926286 RepID=UPI0015C49EC1|nr:efflux RND transporter periplasmic adaptor subunit [Halobacillus massiliensis]